MLVPGIFRESLVDDWMDPFNDEFFGRREGRPPRKPVEFMKTDIREKDDTYELDIDLPGFKKEDISLKLEEGYLTIAAAKTENNDKKDSDGKYIRRERFSGAVQRSFFVGTTIEKEQIRAGFEDGILKITIPKEDKKKIEESKYITIE